VGSDGQLSFEAPAPPIKEFIGQLSMALYEWKENYGPLYYKVDYR
jgi:hypothetical protein